MLTCFSACRYTVFFSLMQSNELQEGVSDTLANSTNNSLMPREERWLCPSCLSLINRTNGCVEQGGSTSEKNYQITKVSVKLFEMKAFKEIGVKLNKKHLNKKELLIFSLL